MKLLDWTISKHWRRTTQSIFRLSIKCEIPMERSVHPYIIFAKLATAGPSKCRLSTCHFATAWEDLNPISFGLGVDDATTRPTPVPRTTEQWMLVRGSFVRSCPRGLMHGRKCAVSEFMVKCYLSSMMCSWWKKTFYSRLVTQIHKHILFINNLPL